MTVQSSAQVRPAPLRPVLGRLVVLLVLSALVAVGRVLCLACQHTAHLLPLAGVQPPPGFPRPPH